VLFSIRNQSLQSMCYFVLKIAIDHQLILVELRPDSSLNEITLYCIVLYFFINQLTAFARRHNWWAVFHPVSQTN